MTFDYVIRTMRNDQAAKTPKMIGYVKREDIALTEEEKKTLKDKFNITFVENTDNPPDGATQYSFTRTTDTDGYVKTIAVSSGPSTGKPLDVDIALFDLLTSSDWDIYPLADVQVAMNQKNTSRW